MDLIKALSEKQLKEVPQILVGDTVRVHVKVKEGARERVPVSYTHLDVYKRQGPSPRGISASGWKAPSPATCWRG